MNSVRVDLDDLRAKALAALQSARERDAECSDGSAPTWIIAPRRDGAVDVVVASSGADVFDRALEVDAKFSVAAQPAVVVALVTRIRDLELALEEATIALEYDDLNEYLSNAANAAREVRKKGVVLR